MRSVIRLIYGAIFLTAGFGVAICPVTVAQPVPAPSCRTLSALWNHAYGRYNLEKEEATYYLIVSNNMFKTMSDVTFKGVGQYSEYLTNLHHFFFNYFLNQEVEKLSNVQVRLIQAPFPKQMTFEVDIKEGGDLLEGSTLQAFIERAKSKSIEAILGYVYTPKTFPLLSLVTDITTPTSTLARSKLYHFAGGRSYIASLSAAKRRVLRGNIIAAFPQAALLTDALTVHYGIGVGPSLVDAQYAAKLSTFEHETFGAVVFGAFEHLKRDLEILAARKNSLAHFFPVGKPQKMRKLFDFLRKWQPEDNPDSLAFEKHLGPFFNLANPAGRQMAAEQAKELQSFTQHLNLMDYLPEAWMKEDSVSRMAFRQLKNPAGLLFIDVRRLGGRNLEAMYNAIDGLLAEINQAERLVMERESLLIKGEKNLTSDDHAHLTAIQQEIFIHLDRVMQQRSFILSASNVFLNQVRKIIAQQFLDVGLSPNDAVIWASGDDMYIVFKKNIPIETVIKKLRANPQIGSHIRMGWQKLRGHKTITLAVARTSVGRTAEVLKYIEALGMGKNLVVRLLVEQGGDIFELIAVDPKNSSFSPLARKKFLLLQQKLPHWSLLNYRGP